MHRQVPANASDRDFALTIGVIVFIIACFGVALGYFLIAIGAAVGVGVLLAVNRTVASRGDLLSSLSGIIAGLIGALLFVAVLSFFIA
jgi:hypothetical protein